MTSIEMVRPRGQGRGATSATTEDAETLLPASEPPAGAGRGTRAPVAVAQGNSVGLFERNSGTSRTRCCLPRPTPVPADSRRVWTWATVSFLLMCVMFGSVAGGPGTAPDFGNSSWPPSSRSETNNETFGPSRRVRDSRTTRNERTPSPSPSRRATPPPDVDDASYLRIERRGFRRAGARPCRTGAHRKRQCVTREARRRPSVPSRRLPIRSFPWQTAPNSALVLLRGRASGGEASNATTELVLVGDSITEAWRGTRPRRGPRRVRVGAGDFGAAPRRVLALAARDRRGHDGKRAVATQERGLSDTETTRSRWGVGAGVRGRVDRHERFEPFDLRAKIFARRRRGENGFSLKNKPSPACVSDDDVASLFAEGVPKTVAGIIAVVEAIVELAPETKIVVLGITPRGERVGNTKVSYLQPSVWSAAIDATNARRRARFGKRKRKGEKGKGGGVVRRLAAVPERGVPAVRGTVPRAGRRGGSAWTSG